MLNSLPLENPFFNIALVIGGIILLIRGADWLVGGASSIAHRLGVSDLMIGLTIVSFGTSAPELIVNILASVKGNADIAIGNVVGSNIANILLILGIAAAITPLAVQRSTVLKEIPFAILASLLLLTMANDHIVDGYAVSELSRSDGLSFIGFFLIFLVYTFGLKRNEDENGHKEPSQPLPKSIGLIAVGLLCLGVGGDLTVRGAEQIALLMGVSQALIGLTVVAIGTSLPELTTSVVAALRGKMDISIGNIVGSNIFNIFWILGLSAIIRPLPFEPSFNMDLLASLGAAVLLFIIIHNGQVHRRLLLWWKQSKNYEIRRWEGWVLLASYVSYVGYITWRG